MSEWKEYRLGEIANIVSERVSISVANLSNYISTENMINNFGGITRAEKLPDVSTINSFKKNDILFSNIRTYFKKVWFSKFEGTVSPDVLVFRVIQSECLDKFLFYSLCNPEFTEFSVLTSKGAKMPRGDKEALINYSILLPSLPEQRAIISILSSLDDKIDLLHRQNATLEKMAETLFRQWFVEEAKEEWKIGRVSDYALHFKASIHPQKNKSTLYFHYSIPSFDNGKDPIREYGEKIQSNKYRIPKYCILFSKLNPHKDKRVWLLQNEVGENSICSTEFQVVLPKKKHYLFFLYGWLTHNENYNEIASGVGGTSGSHQRIDPRTIFQFQCPLIPDHVLELFEKQVESLFNKQITNEQQIRTLTSLRNTLLPKLMSGEVQINN